MKPEKEEQDFENEEELEGADPFAEVAPEKVETQAEETVPSEAKNRQFRRLEQKYQAERESSIRLAAMLEARTEADKFRKETADVDENDAIARIYGTNTPEAREATRLLQKALQETQTKATDAAVEKFREEQRRGDAEVKRQQAHLDEMLENIEEEHGVDLTSNTPAARKARQGFFTLLEKLSPKENGVVKEYADALETWSLYQERQAKPAPSRAKEISARSMVKSGASSAPEQTAEDKAAEKYLKEIGIL